jgi:hypothetical protein
MYDTVTSTWVSQVGESSNYTLLTYTKVGLTTGVDYSFRIRASNLHGFGPFSTVVIIRADDTPA